jgi:hypothetical protein
MAAIFKQLMNNLAAQGWDTLWFRFYRVASAPTLLF